MQALNCSTVVCSKLYTVRSDPLNLSTSHYHSEKFLSDLSGCEERVSERSYVPCMRLLVSLWSCVSKVSNPLGFLNHIVQMPLVICIIWFIYPQSSESDGSHVLIAYHYIKVASIKCGCYICPWSPVVIGAHLRSLIMCFICLRFPVSCGSQALTAYHYNTPGLL